MGRWVLPFVFRSVLVFLGVLGRKYPCDPASFFLRQVGRERVRSGTTRPSGQGSAGGLTLVLKRKKSARLALRICHPRKWFLSYFGPLANVDIELTGLQSTLRT